MSKASEWAECHGAFEREMDEVRERVFGDLKAEAPTCVLIRRGTKNTIGEVRSAQEDQGYDFYPKCRLAGGDYRPDEALALAQWIIDTFGETPSAGPQPSRGAPGLPGGVDRG